MDFSKCIKLKKTYGGANGKKISITFEGNLYMLKFPSVTEENNNLSNMNGNVSEYLDVIYSTNLAYRLRILYLEHFS